jgi:V/A-type H+-transporting ATPase subunit I
MFGDVGHGLLLILAGVFTNRYGTRRRPGGITEALGGIIMAAGFSSFLFGFLYGSVFGLERIIPALWLNPLHNDLTILAVSIAAGAVLMTIGFLFNIGNMYRAGNWGELFFGKRGISGLGLYLLLIAGGVLLILKLIPVWLFFSLLLLLLLLLFFGEPLSRWLQREKPLMSGGWGMYSLQSFVDLFETVIGFFSNTLSFVRLGAFAIAHVSFTIVIYSLAAHKHIIIQLLLISIGTAIIVGFEGLIVGIQAVRLQYYEFYEKFFQGRGHAFEPFKLFDKQEFSRK